MSRFDYDGTQLKNLIIEFNALGVATDGEVAKEVLIAGAKQVKLDWEVAMGKHGYRKPGSSGRGTGETIESIDYPEGVKSISDGHRVDIYPTGERIRGRNKKTRNAEIAFVLDAMEIKAGGDGWVVEADDDSNEHVYPVMTKKFFEIMDKQMKG